MMVDKRWKSNFGKVKKASMNVLSNLTNRLCNRGDVLFVCLALLFFYKQN